MSAGYSVSNARITNSRKGDPSTEPEGIQRVSVCFGPCNDAVILNFRGRDETNVYITSFSNSLFDLISSDLWVPKIKRPTASNMFIPL